ncbi:hypothetical protein RKD27_003192 [Streptomyces sp. SAI-126]|uniref:DUF397 domain-containing protein n=1 Tax=Streptomyces sp. SAI-126 TaxID=3377732 RepID=UPI003C7CDB3B
MNTERVMDGHAQLKWRKSSYSGTGGGDCVEVATTPGTVHVRDSKDRSGLVLGFSTAQWMAFTTHVSATST